LRRRTGLRLRRAGHAMIFLCQHRRSQDHRHGQTRHGRPSRYGLPL
jgi:hypothetical protein